MQTPSPYPLYVLNRDHVMAPHIESMTRARTDISRRMKDAITKWPVRPLHASLFGSFARGEAGIDSDIDLLLIRPRALRGRIEEAWLHQVDEVERNTRLWTGNAAHIIDVAPATFHRMANAADPLVESWRTDAMHIDGLAVRDVVNGAA